MEGSFGNYESLARREIDGAAFEVDQEMSFDDVEELVVGVVLVPVILSLDDSEADHGIVHLTQGLVVPAVCARIGEHFLVDHFERLVEDIETGFVGKWRGCGHGVFLRSG